MYDLVVFFLKYTHREINKNCYTNRVFIFIFLHMLVLISITFHNDILIDQIASKEDGFHSQSSCHASGKQVTHI